MHVGPPFKMICSADSRWRLLLAFVPILASNGCKGGDCFDVKAGGIYDVRLIEKVTAPGISCPAGLDLAVGDILRFRVNRLRYSKATNCSLVRENDLVISSPQTGQVTREPASQTQGGGPGILFGLEFSATTASGCSGRWIVRVEGDGKRNSFDPYESGRPNLIVQRRFVAQRGPNYGPNTSPECAGLNDCNDGWGVELREVSPQ